MFRGILHGSLKERHSGCSKGFLGGGVGKEQNQVIRKVTHHTLLGFCLVLFVEVVLQLP